MYSASEMSDIGDHGMKRNTEKHIRVDWDELLGLSELSNYWGTLDSKLRARLIRCFKNPERYWDGAYSIILRNEFGLGLTLWQAWIAVDPSAPRTGKCTDSHGNVFRDWDRKPTEQNIFDAIRYAATTTSHKVGL
jgi:hypothetical protein